MDNSPERTEDVLTDYNEAGVDLTLIRCFLSLTPAERLRMGEAYLNAFLELRARAKRRQAD